MKFISPVIMSLKNDNKRLKPAYINHVKPFHQLLPSNPSSRFRHVKDRQGEVRENQHRTKLSQLQHARRWTFLISPEWKPEAGQRRHKFEIVTRQRPPKMVLNRDQSRVVKVAATNLRRVTQTPIHHQKPTPSTVEKATPKSHLTAESEPLSPGKPTNNQVPTDDP